MKHTKSFLLVVALLSSLQIFAQKEQTVVGERGLGFSGIWGGYKHQLTQFGDQTSYANGGFFGLEFGKALFLGWGHYSLINDVKWDNIQTQNFDMKWQPFILQYGFQNYKPIHPQIGFEVGPGRIDYADTKDRILVMQPSAGVEINILRWMHLGIDGGYRFVSDANAPGLTNTDLSGWYGQATLKFGFSWGRYHKKVAEKNKKSHFEG